MTSILQPERECWVCHTTRNLHLHHIYHGPNRKVSDQNGFTVFLCFRHHNGSAFGVHFDAGLDQSLKRACQRKFEESHSREEFMKLIGRNYL